MINLSLKTIKELEQQYGNPLYIFNPSEFIENYHEIEDTFRKIYPNYRICYSYKTNYTPAICALVKDLGGYAEVVSDMEYELALKLGYEPKRIVYNGPEKGHYLESHILNHGITNIDRIEEVARICELAKKYPEEVLSVGIRLNYEIDAGYVSRFGIDISEFRNTISLLMASGIRIAGLHCHMSRARGLKQWERRASTMIELVDNYQLFDIDYISLGSGMAGHMDDELKAQFPYVPSYKEYADVVFSKFAEFYKDKKNKPILFTEPGTTLISKYIDFVAKVEGIKHIRDKQFVLLNCSFHNLGETSQMKNLPIRIFHNGGEKAILTESTFVGYTCLEQDIMFRGFTGELAIGDYIVFGNVGGYSIVDKPPFILPNCPMIAYENNKTSLIKRKESFSDIFRSFEF